MVSVISKRNLFLIMKIIFQPFASLAEKEDQAEIRMTFWPSGQLIIFKYFHLFP